MKIKDKNISIAKLVAKYELDEFEFNENTFSYFIEIYKDTNTKKFSTKVYRKDFFILKPSFGEGEQQGADEELIVEDVNFSNQDTFSTEDDALNSVLNKLTEMFS